MKQGAKYPLEPLYSHTHQILPDQLFKALKAPGGGVKQGAKCPKATQSKSPMVPGGGTKRDTDALWLH